MRLVDSGKKFKVVYSLYEHEFLGCLFSSHVVQELDNGSLSLTYQALMPENMSQFNHMLDNEDRALVKHLDKLTSDEIVKKFGGTVRNISEFFSKKFHDAIKDTVLRYVDRLMLEAIPMLRNKPLFESSRDGYPAKTRLSIADDLASVRFLFSPQCR